MPPPIDRDEDDDRTNGLQRRIQPREPPPEGRQRALTAALESGRSSSPGQELTRPISLSRRMGAARRASERSVRPAAAAPGPRRAAAAAAPRGRGRVRRSRGTWPGAPSQDTRPAVFRWLDRCQAQESDRRVRDRRHSRNGPTSARIAASHVRVGLHRRDDHLAHPIAGHRRTASACARRCSGRRRPSRWRASAPTARARSGRSRDSAATCR